MGWVADTTHPPKRSLFSADSVAAEPWITFPLTRESILNMPPEKTIFRTRIDESLKSLFRYVAKFLRFIVPERYPHFMGFIVVTHDFDSAGFNLLHLHGTPPAYLVMPVS